MNFTPPRIYAITDTRISGISHEEQVARLIEGGIKFIQLRDKHASARSFYESAKAAMSIARPHNVTIVINDRVDIALAVGADGVHLGQDDLSPEYARMILGSQGIVGYSTHSLEQAKETLRMPIDYIAIGPVFSTSTKEDPDPVVGPKMIASVKGEIGTLPLVAIGGIAADNIGSVFEAGADAAALITGLISRADQISEAAERLILQADSCDKHR